MQRPPRGYLPLALRAPSLPPANHIVCYLVGERDALVVDPGSPYPAEQRRLERVLYHLLGGGGSVQGVLLTHHHPDHVGGVQALAARFRLPVLAHAATHERVALSGVRRIAVEDGASLFVDEDHRRLATLHTPGHAVGHLCLFEAARGVLISGDMVLGGGTTLIDPDQGHMGQYLRSLHRLAALHPRVVLPAHGEPLVQGRAAIAALIAHRVAREERVLATLRQAETPLALVEVAHRAYMELSPLYFSLAVRSTHAHLLELERRNLASEDEKGWNALVASG